MKPIALLNSEVVLPLDDFAKVPATSLNARTHQRTTRAVPFKVRWRNQIAGDRTLTALAVRTAILLADYYDDRKGYAWPSQIRLAAELNASRGGVRQAIKRLEDAGYVEYVPEKGRKRTNRYFLRLPTPRKWPLA